MTRSFLPILTLLGAGACAAAFQGGRFRYTDGNLTVLAKSGRSVQNAEGNYTFTLRGNVEIDSAQDGLKLTSEQLVCETAAGKSRKTELRRAIATTRVHAVKTVTGAAGRQVTDITGSRGDLKAQAGGSLLTLSGPVTIQDFDAGTRKTMTATGSSAVATLEPGTRISFSSGLRHATLTGPVKVTVVQAAVKGRGASRLVATGNRMDLTNSAKEPVIVMTGNVSVHGEGDSRFGSFTGLGRARIRMNSAREVVGFDTEAG